MLDVLLTLSKRSAKDLNGSGRARRARMWQRQALCVRGSVVDTKNATVVKSCACEEHVHYSAIKNHSISRHKKIVTRGSV
jgi:hypothetical protein